MNIKDDVVRYEHNPIIRVKDVPYQCKKVYNCAAVKKDGQYFLILRTDLPNGDQCLGLAISNDGYNFTVEPKPVMVANEEEGTMVYDPRITKIGGLYYLCYGADTPYGIRLGIASTTDFRKFKRISLSEPDNRNGVLFPEKINGYYVRLDRPFARIYSLERPYDIWISYSPDLVFWGKSKLFLSYSVIPWGSHKIGPGAPPIKTKEGWIEIFHGAELINEKVGNMIKRKRYRAGCMLLDLEDPSKIRGICKYPIIDTEMGYEKDPGFSRDVVFPSGAILEDNGEVKIYYGASDNCIAVATAKISDLINLCLQKTSRI
jgi:beta-1,4-mannooligosaccharide/beta-1,4-mannosyl-N-acetylglucosamine phosphorylase